MFRNFAKFVPRFKLGIKFTSNAPKVIFVKRISLFPVVAAFSWGSTQSIQINQPVANKQQKMAEFNSKEYCEQCDKMYTENKIVELYTQIQEHKDTKDDEIMWRIARVTYEHAKGKDDKKKKELTYEAFEVIKKALEINEKNYAVHKWYAILLDSTGEFEGTKARITSAYTCKEHFMRAIELNKNDATSIYSLGFWCFIFADMAWYTKKIAAVIFSTPPSSTYEEALEYFMKAEEVDPGFYSKNLLMIGKTLKCLKRKEESITYLMKVYKINVVTEDDKAAHKEAVQLLEQMGASLN